MPKFVLGNIWLHFSLKCPKRYILLYCVIKLDKNAKIILSIFNGCRNNRGFFTVCYCMQTNDLALKRFRKEFLYLWGKKLVFFIPFSLESSTSQKKNYSILTDETINQWVSFNCKNAHFIRNRQRQRVGKKHLIITCMSEKYAKQTYFSMKILSYSHTWQFH